MSKDGSQVGSSAAISVADDDLKKILQGIHAWHSEYDKEDKQNKTSPRNPFNENSYKEKDKINARKKFLADLDKYYNDAESKSNGVGSSFIKPEEKKGLDEELQKHNYYHNNGPKKIDKPTDNHKALSYTIPGNQDPISIVHHSKSNPNDKKDEIFISEETIARLKKQTSAKDSDPVVIAVDRVDDNGNRMKGAKDYLIFQNGELIVEASVDADGNPKGQTRIQGLEHIVKAHAMNREHYKEHMLAREDIGLKIGGSELLPETSIDNPISQNTVNTTVTPETRIDNPISQNTVNTTVTPETSIEQSLSAQGYGKSAPGESNDPIDPNDPFGTKQNSLQTNLNAQERFTAFDDITPNPQNPAHDPQQQTTNLNSKVDDFAMDDIYPFQDNVANQSMPPFGIGSNSASDKDPGITANSVTTKKDNTYSIKLSNDNGKTLKVSFQKNGTERLFSVDKASLESHLKKQSDKPHNLGQTTEFQLNIGENIQNKDLPLTKEEFKMMNRVMQGLVLGRLAQVEQNPVKQTSGVKDNKEPNMSDRQKLMEAIESGITKNVNKVIMNLDDAFETINSLGKKGQTPFGKAISEGKAEMVVAMSGFAEFDQKHSFDQKHQKGQNAFELINGLEQYKSTAIKKELHVFIKIPETNTKNFMKLLDEAMKEKKEEVVKPMAKFDALNNGQPILREKDANPTISKSKQLENQILTDEINKLTQTERDAKTQKVENKIVGENPITTVIQSSTQEQQIVGPNTTSQLSTTSNRKTSVPSQDNPTLDLENFNLDAFINRGKIQPNYPPERSSTAVTSSPLTGNQKPPSPPPPPPRRSDAKSGIAVNEGNTNAVNKGLPPSKPPPPPYPKPSDLKVEDDKNQNMGIFKNAAPIFDRIQTNQSVKSNDVESNDDEWTLYDEYQKPKALPQQSTVPANQSNKEGQKSSSKNATKNPQISKPMTDNTQTSNVGSSNETQETLSTSLAKRRAGINGDEESNNLVKEPTKTNKISDNIKKALSSKLFPPKINKENLPEIKSLLDERKKDLEAILKLKPSAEKNRSISSESISSEASTDKESNLSSPPNSPKSKNSNSYRTVGGTVQPTKDIAGDIAGDIELTQLTTNHKIKSQTTHNKSGHGELSPSPSPNGGKPQGGRGMV
jgi:hypothetical protein